VCPSENVEQKQSSKLLVLFCQVFRNSALDFWGGPGRYFWKAFGRPIPSHSPVGLFLKVPVQTLPRPCKTSQADARSETVPDDAYCCKPLNGYARGRGLETQRITSFLPAILDPDWGDKLGYSLGDPLGGYPRGVSPGDPPGYPPGGLPQGLGAYDAHVGGIAGRARPRHIHSLGGRRWPWQSRPARHSVAAPSCQLGKLSICATVFVRKAKHFRGKNYHPGIKNTTREPSDIKPYFSDNPAKLFINLMDGLFVSKKRPMEEDDDPRRPYVSYECLAFRMLSFPGA
jgi:hypothetical protein